MLRFRCLHLDGSSEDVQLDGYALFCDGYTGRDQDAVMRHVKELEEDLGVPAPSSVPTCYPMAARLALQEPGEIEVYGARTSGEIEPVLAVQGGRPRYLLVGSDHTDRGMEAYSIPLAKNVAPKILSTEAWAVDEVLDRWDELELRSWSDGELYQEAPLALMLPLERLLAAVPADRLRDPSVIMGGTIPTVAGFRFGTRFEGSLSDRRSGRELRIAYGVRVMEPIG